MLTLNWVRCAGNQYCPFETVDLSKVTVGGVYAIWYSGQPGRVVRLGQGDIATRIKDHRVDSAVLAYLGRGRLWVTWAALQPYQRDGVEKYLSNKYPPLVGDAFLDAVPIAVNSPW
jgi:hypothetical protein